MTSSRDAVPFKCQNTIQYEMPLLYSLSRLSLVACAMSPCRPAGTKQVSNPVMPFGQQAIVPDNHLLTAPSAGAYRQQIDMRRSPADCLKRVLSGPSPVPAA